MIDLQLGNGRLGQFDRCVVELIDQVFCTEVGLGHRVGRKRIGFQDISASEQIIQMNFLNDLRPGEGEQFIIAFQIACGVLESLASKVGFGKL